MVFLLNYSLSLSLYYLSNEETAFSISFSLIPFNGTLFSCPKSVEHTSGSVFVPIFLGEIIYNKGSTSHTKISITTLNNTYRILQRVSVPPHVLRGSTLASKDSLLLTFRTISEGNFALLRSVSMFGISGNGVRARLLIPRTIMV